MKGTEKMYLFTLTYFLEICRYSERQWQLIRRSHYAEFNLVYDRGTKFGLLTPGARYESILMSLPPLSKWEYMNKVPVGSREYKLTEVLKNPKEWV